MEIVPSPKVHIDLHVEQWRRDDFNYWEFDRKTDSREGDDFFLHLAGTTEDAADALFEILSRMQRLIRRRNRHSSGRLFDRILELHRALHPLEKPLVRSDYDHALDTWQWTLRLAPEAGIELQLAALLHDLERLCTEADTRIESGAADYRSFKNAHAEQGARMAEHLLRDAGLGQERITAVARLIELHEHPGDHHELNILNDADALSFFSLNSPGFFDYYGPRHGRMKVAYTLARISHAERERLRSLRLRGDVAAALSTAMASVAPPEDFQGKTHAVPREIHTEDRNRNFPCTTEQPISGDFHRDITARHAGQ